MFQVTVCRACHGDVFVDDEGDGAYLRCAGCSFICDLVEREPKLRALHSSYVADFVEDSPALQVLLPN